MYAPSPGRSIRVATLNIWNIQGPDTRRMVALPTFLASIAADVLLLQEVSFDASTAPQSAFIAAKLGYQTERYFHAGTWRGRNEGLAILARYPAVAQFRRALPMGADKMGRIVCGLTLETPFGEVDAFTTHLAYPIDAGDDRVAQANACMEFIQQIGSRNIVRPTVLAGDLNDVPDSATVGVIVASLTDTLEKLHGDERITFAQDNLYTTANLVPGRCIDYIFHNSLFSTQRAEIAGPGLATHEVPSDHHAVVADLLL